MEDLTGWLWGKRGQRAFLFFFLGGVAGTTGKDTKPTKTNRPLKPATLFLYFGFSSE
jgi:hypothetical protein